MKTAGMAKVKRGSSNNALGCVGAVLAWSALQNHMEQYKPGLIPTKIVTNDLLNQNG